MRGWYPSAQLPNLKHIRRAVCNRCLRESFSVEPGMDGKLGHTAWREAKRKSLPKQKRARGSIAWVCGIYFFSGLGNKCSLWLYPGGNNWPLIYYTEELCDLSSTTGCSKVILYVSCPSSRTSHFSKKLWFLLLENVAKIWALGELIVIRVSLLLAPLGCQSNKIYTYMKLCIYTYLYFCV